MSISASMPPLIQISSDVMLAREVSQTSQQAPKLGAAVGESVGDSEGLRVGERVG